MRPKYRFSKNRTSIRRKVAFFLLFTVIISFTLSLCVNARLRPLIKDTAESEANKTALSIINESIFRRLAEGETTYDSLSEVRYDQNGKVSLIKSNIAAINNERANIALYILEQYKEKTLISEVALGTVSGIDILSGMGPEVKIELSSAPKINTEIYNEFIDAGINQTLHRIMMEVEIDTKVLVPSSSFTVTTKASVCIAETIIVGEVPDAYTDIHRSGGDIAESDIDDIFDFGASID